MSEDQQREPEQLSLLDSDAAVPLLTIPAPELRITFHHEGDEVGNLWWDKDTSEFKFEGTVDKSVDIFLEFLTNQFKEWIDTTYGPGARGEG